MKHFHFTIFRYPRVYPFQKIWCLASAIFLHFGRFGEPCRNFSSENNRTSNGQAMFFRELDIRELVDLTRDEKS